ncbi:MAG: late control protein, partial [Pseudomonadota bacterium]
YAAVLAHWHDVEAGEKKSVTAGSGQPVFALPMVYDDQSKATNAAFARLRRFQRGKVKLSLSLIGNANIFAETPLQLVGFRAGIVGDWVVSSVTHTLDSSGFKTALDAEKVI